MNQFLTRLHFTLFLVTPFVLSSSLIVAAFGCRQGSSVQEQPRPAITIENLQTAYGKSLARQHMYSLFMKQAEKDRLPNVARLYRAISRSEEIHAQNHARLLQTYNVEALPEPTESVVVGTTLQTLKLSLSSEQIESHSMYPNLMKTAESEGCQEAVDQFRTIREADLRQSELLKDAYDRNGKISKTRLFVCSKCGYILTSEKTEKCPNCHCQKKLFEEV